MTITRRDFIKFLGVSLAWVSITHCAALTALNRDDSPRGRLRQAWFRLSDLANTTKKNYERGEELLNQLTSDHRAALDDLIASGELETKVADPIQEAYEAASWHIWRSNAPMTCYEPMIGPEYTPSSSDQLAKQSEILAEMAGKSVIDPETLAQAQATIERDITFLALSDEDTQALYEKIRQAAGDAGYPQLDEIDLEVSPEAAEAARYLVDILLGK